jgi:hypothetical protein
MRLKKWLITGMTVAVTGMVVAGNERWVSIGGTSLARMYIDQKTLRKDDSDGRIATAWVRIVLSTPRAHKDQVYTATAVRYTVDCPNLTLNMREIIYYDRVDGKVVDMINLEDLGKNEQGPPGSMHESIIEYSCSHARNHKGKGTRE